MSDSSRRRSARSNLPVPVTGQLAVPAHLHYPAKSQVEQAQDEVTSRIALLDGKAAELGKRYGIPFSGFELNQNVALDSDKPAVALSGALRELMIRKEQISLERHDGKWGLIYTRLPAIIASERHQEERRWLRDTSMEVRQAFLQRSEDFFREYIELCSSKLGEMRTSIAAADRTLALLERPESQ